MTEQGNNEWETLKNYEDYQININYPHQIGKKGTEKIIIKYENKDGYLHCSLNRKKSLYYLSLFLIGYNFQKT